MDLLIPNIYSESVLIYQVPFCGPFWRSMSNFTEANKDRPTLWELLPPECKTSNSIALAIACIVIIVCVLIHLGTIVAYSTLKYAALDKEKRYEEDRSSSRRKEKTKRKSEPGLIKETADFAFAMTTQKRLRRGLAFIGLLSTGVMLPMIMSSTATVYAQPFAKMHDANFHSQMARYGTTISALFHLTSTAFFCTLLLMVVERIRETLRICADNFFKSSFAEVGRAKLNDDIYGSVRSDYRALKRPRTPRNPRPNSIIGRISQSQMILRYSFRESYSFIDLITVLFVPGTSAIVTTLALAVFNSRFELFGLTVSSPGPNSIEYIPGILSFNNESYPDVVYFYACSIGILLVLLVAGNVISLVRVKDLMSSAKRLAGYERALIAYEHDTYNRKSKEDWSRKQQIVSRTGPDSVRLSRRKQTGYGSNRQDTDGLSFSKDNIDIDEMESSFSNLPLPPPPSDMRLSTASFDDLSLPPPPRPDSIAESKIASIYSFPSLPSMLREEDFAEVDAVREEITAEKSLAFFGNIRQSKVTAIAFVVFFIFTAPVLIIFAAGIFYPHDGQMSGIMGGKPNITNNSVIAKEPKIIFSIEGSAEIFIGIPSPPQKQLSPVDLTGANSNIYDNQIQEIKTASERRNWVTTLSAVFLIVYALASIAPFVVFCSSSPLFRKEVKRFYSCCLCCHLNNYKKSEQLREGDRSRSNRNLALATPKATHIRSPQNYYEAPRSRSSLGVTRERHSMNNSRNMNRPIRREKTIAGTRNVSWELSETSSPYK